jgi:hypothetical protein
MNIDLIILERSSFEILFSATQTAISSNLIIISFISIQFNLKKLSRTVIAVLLFQSLKQ